MKNLNYIIESVVDITRKNLDPLVFDFVVGSYVMKPDIVSYLKQVIDEINFNIVNINNAFVKGSILSFQWNENSDIDLLLEIDQNIREEDLNKIQNKIDERYSDNVPTTTHPLQIYVLPGKYDTRKADGIYDLDSGWVKGPYNISVNIDNYYDKFHKMVSSIDISTGELKRKIIDYNMLNKLNEEEIGGLSNKINKKLEEINSKVEDIVSQYKHIKNMRKNAFSDEMTPQEISEYGSKNSLPSNVIFKLMERYYYLSMMRELKSIIEKSKIDTEEEVEEVKDSIKRLDG